MMMMMGKGGATGHDDEASCYHWTRAEQHRQREEWWLERRAGKRKTVRAWRKRVVCGGRLRTM